MCSKVQYSQLTVTIANNEAVSGAIDMRRFTGGMVVIPAAWTDANLGFKVSTEEAGTYTILKGATGTPIQISSITTNASFAYSLPTELAGALWVKLWSKNTTAATTTDNNQGGARSIGVYLKG